MPPVGIRLEGLTHRITVVWEEAVFQIAARRGGTFYAAEGRYAGLGALGTLFAETAAPAGEVAQGA